MNASVICSNKNSWLVMRSRAIEMSMRELIFACELSIDRDSPKNYLDSGSSIHDGRVTSLFLWTNDDVLKIKTSRCCKNCFCSWW